MPGLDGLRAIAVLAVIAYHLDLGWAPGGLLGVGVFFTLSGYLITDLLLGQRAASGSLKLGEFWIRRARRLLPAVFLMIAVVVAWVTLLEPVLPPRPQERRARRDLLREQLVEHRPGGLLFRPVRAAAPAGAPLVVGGGGAVLPDLAVAGLAGPALHPQTPGAGRHDAVRPGAGALRRLRHRHVGALPARHRPDAGLRGNRHPRLRPAPGSGAGDGVAEPPSERRPRHQVARPAWTAWGSQGSW